MVERKVDLVITGELRDGASAQSARTELARLFRRSAYEIDYVFATLPFTIRRDLPLSELPRYLNMFREAGVVVKVVPAGQTYVPAAESDAMPAQVSPAPTLPTSETAPIPAVEAPIASAPQEPESQAVVEPAEEPHAAEVAQPAPESPAQHQPEHHKPMQTTSTSPAEEAMTHEAALLRTMSHENGNAVPALTSAPTEIVAPRAEPLPLTEPSEDAMAGVLVATPVSEVLHAVMQSPTPFPSTASIAALAKESGAREPDVAVLDRDQFATAEPIHVTEAIPTPAEITPFEPSADKVTGTEISGTSSEAALAHEFESGAALSTQSPSDPAAEDFETPAIEPTAPASSTSPELPESTEEPPLGASSHMPEPTQKVFDAGSMAAAFGFAGPPAPEAPKAAVIPFPVNLSPRAPLSSDTSTSAPHVPRAGAIVKDITKPAIVREGGVRETPRLEPSPLETSTGLKIEALRANPLSGGGGLEAMGPAPSASELAAAIAVDMDFESVTAAAPEATPTSASVSSTSAKFGKKADPFALPKLEEAPPPPPAPVAPPLAEAAPAAPLAPSGPPTAPATQAGPAAQSGAQPVRPLPTTAPGPEVDEIVCPKCATRQPRRTLCSNCGIDMRRASAAAVESARLGPIEEERPKDLGTDALIEFLPNVFSLSIDGRIGRMRFLAWSLPGALMWTFLQFVSHLIAHVSWLPLVMLVFGFGFIASLLLTLRFSALRLHDFGYGGAWTFLWLVPGLNLLLLGFLAGTPGEKGINRYGSRPPGNTPLVYAAAAIFILVVVVDVLAAVGLFG